MQLLSATKQFQVVVVAVEVVEVAVLLLYGSVTARYYAVESAESACAGQRQRLAACGGFAARLVRRDIRRPRRTGQWMFGN